MKLEPITDNNGRIENTVQNLDWLEKSFTKLELERDTTSQLEDKLKELNLEDNKGKLIERGPIKIKDNKWSVNNPYHKVTENVSVKHNSGGIAYTIPNLPQENYFNVSRSTCNDCFDLSQCNECILQVAYSPEFTDHLQSLQETEENHLISHETYHQVIDVNQTLTNEQFTTYNTEFIKPPSQLPPFEETYLNTTEPFCQRSYPVDIPPRRLSLDSGFQSDNPSPRYDCILSPPQTGKIEKASPSYRKILPKPEDMQRKVESVVASSAKVKKAGQKSAKERMRSTLNADVKQVKWIGIVVKNQDDKMFETTSNGETVVHKLLLSNDKYTAESLYATVEKMKMNPSRCSGIVAAQSSICDTIKRNKQPQVWIDYICEAVDRIQDKMKQEQK